MNIEIFGGINEIGGNKIFISAGDKKFLFDFGLSFSDNNQYFSEFLNPRKFNGIIDYLYLDLIPPLNNLYRNDLITPFSDVLNSKHYNITPSNQNIVDAFFLTHTHMDHYKFIGFLKKETPIYVNWISDTILDYLSKASTDPLLSDILNFYESFKLVPKKKKKASEEEIQYKRANKNDYNHSEIKRKIIIMDEEKPYKFNSTKGEILINQYKTDHSIPGACSYIITNDGTSIIYTGDFRMHGAHKEWVNNFMQKAKEANPIAIITEGTRVPSLEDFKNGSYRSEDQSEDDVEIRSRDLIRKHSGLILVNCPTRNLDRLLLYYSLAKENDRTFAITPKIFQLVDSFRMRLDNMNEAEIKEFYKHYHLPDFHDKHFKVYLPRKGWGIFESKDYKVYDKEVFKIKNYITYKDIKNNPEQFILYLDYFMTTELIDLDQPENSVLFINSTTDPFNEEMLLKEDKLNAWLNRFGVLKTETIHSSGHCNVDDLINFLKEIDADNVIPVHTNHPEVFEDFGLNGKIILPKKGKTYTF